MAVEIALLGAGRMGSLHARTLTRTHGAHLSVVIDPDPARAEALAAEVGAAWNTSLDDCAELDRCAAVLIAAPTSTHHSLTLELLRRGKHVLVEKPMAATSAQAAEMRDAAAAAGKLLAVGHVERFNPVCSELVRYVNAPLFVQSHRLSPFELRGMDGVILDLMLHDIDIVTAFDSSQVSTVTAEAVTSRSATEDLAVCTMRLESGLVCQFNVSRISQRKVRTMQVTLQDSVIDTDLLMHTMTISRDTTGMLIEGGNRRYRQHTVTEVPYMSGGEPLALELRDFIDAVTDGRPPMIDAEIGLQAILRCELVAEAAARSTEAWTGSAS